MRHLLTNCPNCAGELEIIDNINSMKLSGEDKDIITDIVKEALDRHFR